MKLFKLSFLLLALLSVAACGEDDDTGGDTTVCTQSDWVGTYAGTLDCDGTVEDVTVTITASGIDDIIIVYATSSLTTTYDPLAFTGCDLTASSSDVNQTLTLNVALNGDQLTLNESRAEAGTNSSCTITASRI